MKKEYDFSKGKKNPYITDLKKQVTIRLDTETIGAYRKINDTRYQTLTSLYLRDYTQKHKKLSVGGRLANNKSSLLFS